MKIKIISTTKSKTKTGKEYLKIKAKTSAGEQVLYAWKESQPKWDILQEGKEVDVAIKNSGKYLTIAEIEGWKVPRTEYKPQKKEEDIKMKRIKEYNKSKEEGMRKMGAMRDAVQIVCAFYGYKADKMTEEDIEKKIYEWFQKIYEMSDQPFV